MSDTAEERIAHYATYQMSEFIVARTNHDGSIVFDHNVRGVIFEMSQEDVEKVSSNSVNTMFYFRPLNWSDVTSMAAQVPEPGFQPTYGMGRFRFVGAHRIDTTGAWIVELMHRESQELVRVSNWSDFGKLQDH